MAESQRALPKSSIRALIRGERQITQEDLTRVIAHVAKAPFASRPIRVAPELQGKEYLGHQLGHTAPSHLAHLAKRVLLERQWRYGTTVEEYFNDLRSATRHPGARIAAFVSHGVCRVGLLSPNTVPLERLGDRAQSWLWVLYDAEHDTITSGYQVSRLEEISLPKDARWLK